MWRWCCDEVSIWNGWETPLYEHAPSCLRRAILVGQQQNYFGNGSTIDKGHALSAWMRLPPHPYMPWDWHPSEERRVATLFHVENRISQKLPAIWHFWAFSRITHWWKVATLRSCARSSTPMYELDGSSRIWWCGACALCDCSIQTSEFLPKFSVGGPIEGTRNAIETPRKRPTVGHSNAQ